VNLRNSLVGRLVGLAAVWAVALLLAGAIGLTSLYSNTVFRDVEDGLDGTIRSLLENLQTADDGAVAVAAIPLDPRYSQTYSGRYWQVFQLGPDAGTTPIVGSRSLWDEFLRVDAELASRALARPGQRVTGGGDGPEEQELYVLASAVRIGAREDFVLVAAAVDRAPADRDVRAFALATSWTLAGFALALVGVVLLQVRWGLAPLFAMREAVAEIREGGRERLEESAPMELAPLARELNALIDHNRDVVERARAHVGNLAHALKTPISVVLNESRTQSGPFAETVQRQTEKMQVQVEHHLRRASAAARAQAIGSRALVGGVVDDLARTLPRMYPDQHLDLDTQVTAELTFRGERQDLEEMVGNLLDNAFKWAKSRVRVTASLEAAPGRMLIVVEDDGEGLPHDRRIDVISRGARLDEATPGSGLGLSIVDDLAKAYGGSLELSDSTLGGLAAALNLPAITTRNVTAR